MDAVIDLSMLRYTFHRLSDRSMKDLKWVESHRSSQSKPSADPQCPPSICTRRQNRHRRSPSLSPIAVVVGGISSRSPTFFIKSTHFSLFGATAARRGHRRPLRVLTRRLRAGRGGRRGPEGLRAMRKNRGYFSLCLAAISARNENVQSA